MGVTRADCTLARAVTLGVAFGVVLVGGLAACRDDSCLRGTCELPCGGVSFAAEPACLARADRPLYVGRVGDAPAEYRLARGNAAANDIVMTNGLVVAVISAIDAPNDLTPTGGNVIDLGPFGGVDDMTVVYQLSGILPDDAFAYTSLSFEAKPGSVSVTVRGTLDGRHDVTVVTHYELTGCDFGVRVRSELFNGSTDTEAFMIADTMHWGDRRIVPFVPAVGQGFSQPKLDLLELAALWKPYDFSAGALPANDTPGYAALACDRMQLSGVNDLGISALGTPMTYVAPGDTLVLERMLLAAGAGDGLAPAIDLALAARAQLFDEPTVKVHGRIVAGGMPFGGDIRRASVEIRADGRPITSVIPGTDGTFTASAPANAMIEADVWSFGRKVASASGADLGDIEVPEPARLQLTVDRDGASDWAIVALTPADAATLTDVTGTFHGRLTTCAPWLGPPNGPSPACNQVIVSPQGTEVEVPAGRYTLIATGGPEHTLARASVALVAGEITQVSLAVAALEVAPPGWLSADFHVHGRTSFDSGLPDDDRVRTFVASGIDVIAATDHDVIGDYAQTVATLGLDDRIAVMGGLEATQVIPWMDIPGETLPRVIGHFNFWPLAQVPSDARAGAPWDELIEPGALFDRMAPLVGDSGMMQMNHPWSDPQFGRDLGYLRSIKYDPRLPIEADANARLLRRPAGQHRNLDWNAIEIINGASAKEMMMARPLWFSLLAQGFVAPGTGNSDSHGMIDNQLGWARNWVQTTTSVAGFSAQALDAAVRDGRTIAGDGVVVLVEVGPVAGPRRGLGFSPYTAMPGDVLSIEVRAAPWVPVDEVRVVTSRGTRIVATAVDLEQPTDPFGSTGVLRYSARLPLASLVDRDDFIVVEAGLAYPLAGDLDDDGVLDTSDNNGDGRVDMLDVEPDEDTGPLAMPADPSDPADRRFAISRIVPGAWPEGFANPLFIIVDGDDWTPPGVGP
jgi:hypothetical protein